MFLNKFLKNHLTIPQATNLFEEIKSQTHPNINDLERLVNFHKADCPLWCADYSIEQLSYYIAQPFAFESPLGAPVIQYIENSIIPYINLQKMFKPRKKGTVEVPPSGPFS